MMNGNILQREATLPLLFLCLFSLDVKNQLSCRKIINSFVKVSNKGSKWTVKTVSTRNVRKS